MTQDNKKMLKDRKKKNAGECAGTLAGDYEAGHAVGHAGAGGQEGDTHNEVGDVECEADDGDLQRHKPCRHCPKAGTLPSGPH